MPLGHTESAYLQVGTLQQRVEISYNCAKGLFSPTGDTRNASGHTPMPHTHQVRNSGRDTICEYIEVIEA
jgi:hypothetical protein